MHPSVAATSPSLAIIPLLHISSCDMWRRGITSSMMGTHVRRLTMAIRSLSRYRIRAGSRPATISQNTQSGRANPFVAAAWLVIDPLPSSCTPIHRLLYSIAVACCHEWVTAVPQCRSHYTNHRSGVSTTAELAPLTIASPMPCGMIANGSPAFFGMRQALSPFSFFYVSIGYSHYQHVRRPR